MKEGQLSEQELKGLQFRDAMARLGAAVNVITSDGHAGRLGVTATAVCSVSDSPPTVLVCINRKCAQNEPLKANGVFCVNILSAEQEDVSALFAGVGQYSTEERFERTDWQTLETGSPVISGCVASCDCRVQSIHEVGTHSIIIGNVVAVDLPLKPRDGLTYFSRTYHKLSATKQ